MWVDFEKSLGLFWKSSEETRPDHQLISNKYEDFLQNDQKTQELEHSRPIWRSRMAGDVATLVGLGHELLVWPLPRLHEIWQVEISHFGPLVSKYSSFSILVEWASVSFYINFILMNLDSCECRMEEIKIVATEK